jgi:hypothetical protein
VDEEKRTYLGIAVARGAVYLGVVREPDELLLDDLAERIQPSAQLELDAQLGDVRDRVRQELRRLKPAAVGVARTRKYMNWKYQPAFDRFSLEAAAILACVDAGVPCRMVRGEDAAKAVPAPPSQIAEHALQNWSITPTAYWKDRVWAFATAMALAKGTDR